MNISLEQLTHFFGWLTIVNGIILILSTVGIFLMRDMATKIQGKMFAISPEELNVIYFKYLGHYKVVIIAFNLAPYIALKLMQG